jgi:long-subunit fatty acid transport protein
MALRGTTTLTRVLACLGVFVAASHAQAEGIETTVSGTVGLGRAATVLRVNDFMATWQNPANLAVIPSNDLGAELRLPLLDACFDRIQDPDAKYRTMNPAQGYYGSESFKPVCNKGSIMPAGNLGWAQAFESGFGYGIGFFTPAAVPNLEYGSDVVVSQALNPDNERYPITLSGEESPNRFLLLKRQQLGGFLQVGAGYRFSPLVRVGASLGWGFATLQNRSIASVQGGTFQDQEVLNDVRVSDAFIPRAMASVVVTPLPSLELAAALTYQGDVDGVGSIDVTANGIQGAPRGNCRAPEGTSPGPHCRIDDVKLTAPFPRLSATVGVRYASLRAGRTRALDPMKDEHWDIELNGTWSQTSHVDQYSITVFEGTPGARIAFSSSERGNALPLPATLTIPYNWKDTLGLRLGGDYNILPNFLAVRAGVSYESNAIPTAYMNIDAWAVTRVGLHAGGTLKLGNLKLSIAYAHIFFGDVSVPLKQGRITEIVSANPTQAQPVNEGDYTASLNVISGQINYAF